MTQNNSNVPLTHVRSAPVSQGSAKLPWTAPALRKSAVPEVTQAAANTMGDAAGSS